MSLQTRLEAVIAAIGADIKALQQAGAGSTDFSTLVTARDGITIPSADLDVSSYGLNAKLSNGKLASAVPSTYPEGITTASVTTGNGWPSAGVLTTVRNSDAGYASQTLMGVGGTSGEVYVRTQASSGSDTWTSWSEVSGSTFKVGGVRAARRASTMTNSSGATLSGDALRVNTLPVGEYAFEINGMYTCSATSVGFRFGFAFYSPGTSTILAANLPTGDLGAMIATSATASSNILASNLASNTSYGSATSSGGSAYMPFQISGSLQVNTPMDLAFKFAQASAGSSNLYRSSYLRVTRIS